MVLHEQKIEIESSGMIIRVLKATPVTAKNHISRVAILRAYCRTLFSFPANLPQCISRTPTVLIETDETVFS